jgi:hypothetical protein
MGRITCNQFEECTSSYQATFHNNLTYNHYMVQFHYITPSQLVTTYYGMVWYGNGSIEMSG